MAAIEAKRSTGCFDYYFSASWSEMWADGRKSYEWFYCLEVQPADGSVSSALSRGNIPASRLEADVKRSMTQWSVIDRPSSVGMVEFIDDVVKAIRDAGLVT